MAFDASKLYSLYSGPPGFGLFVYKSSSDTKEVIISGGYFNNVDDALNLSSGDTIICKGTNGGVILDVDAISSGAVQASPLNLEDNLSLHKEAFGSLSVVQNTPILFLRFNYSTNTILYADNSSDSGTFTVSDSLATVDSGTDAAGKGSMASAHTAAYIPGQGLVCRFTALFPEAGVVNNVRTAGLGDGADGLYFGYNGTAFGVAHQSGGALTWIAQTSWSEDTMDGSGDVSNPSAVNIDHTKGNVYQVQFQWLGFGMIKYYVENPSTGNFVLVHKVEYANANTSPSMLNPTLPLCLQSLNSGSTTSTTIKSGSMAVYSEGPRETTNLVFAEDNTKNVGTTETNILTIRNKATYQSKTNRITVRPLIFSTSSDGTKPATVRVYANATLGGTPSYTDINTANSVVDYDTAGTTVTGGTKQGSFKLDKTDSLTINVTDLDVDIHPGDTLTFTAVVPSSTSDVAVSLTWAEEF